MKKNLFLCLLFCGVAIILIIILFFLFFEIKYPLHYKNEIKLASQKYDLEASLVASIINTESSFDENAKSKSGAEGLMQLMPSTARYVAEKYSIEFDGNLFVAEKNLEIGCCYIKYLFNKFQDETTVLFAYNSGEGNVATWLKNSEFSHDGKTLFSCPFEETNSYVQKVQSSKRIYSKKISN